MDKQELHHHHRIASSIHTSIQATEKKILQTTYLPVPMPLPKTEQKTGEREDIKRRACYCDMMISRLLHCKVVRFPRRVIINQVLP